MDEVHSRKPGLLALAISIALLSASLFGGSAQGGQSPDPTPSPLGSGEAPQIAILVTGPEEIRLGETFSYLAFVWVPVDRPLHDIAVSDPECDELPIRFEERGDNDVNLEIGELWAYKCPHHAVPNDPNPLLNTTTATGTTNEGQTATAQDSHLVMLILPPEIRIEKSAFRDQVDVGDEMAYVMEVSTPISSNPLQRVKVTDKKCDSHPQLSRKEGGDQDEWLELGEVWIYLCERIARQRDVGRLRNVATAAGSTAIGERVRDRDREWVRVNPPHSGPLRVALSSRAGVQIRTHERDV